MKRCPGRSAVACALFAGGVGCSTPDDHFHTLRSAPPPAAAASARSPAGVLSIGPVSVPEALARSQWLIREGDTGVRVYEHQLWPQSLAAEIAEGLADRLASGADASTWFDADPAATLLDPVHADAGALRLRVQVTRFDARLAPAASVADTLRWTLECGTPERRWAVLRSAVREIELPAPQASGDANPTDAFDALARAHAQALSLVAADVGAAQRDTDGERRTRCQDAR